MYSQEFACRGRVISPNAMRNRNHRYVEMEITRDLFEDFAYHYCRNLPVILFGRAFRVDGFFSRRHPLEHCSQDITIYLTRVSHESSKESDEATAHQYGRSISEEQSRYHYRH